MKRGFTIIELLMVLAIIALLAGAATVFFSPSAAKGRDSRREEDMKSLQSALNLYINQKLTYPVCFQEKPIDSNTDCLSQALLGDDAIVSMPIDPRDKGTGDCGDANAFRYCYESADGLSYIIRYHLETDSVQGKSAGWQIVLP